MYEGTCVGDDCKVAEPTNSPDKIRMLKNARVPVCRLRLSRDQNPTATRVPTL